MLCFYAYADGKLTEVPSMADGRIVRAIRPTPEEIALVQEATGVPSDMLVAATDRDERSRTEFDDPFKLLIVRIPHHVLTDRDVPYVTLAFGVILAPGRIITVCSEESLVWTHMLSGRTRIPAPDDVIPFLCTLFMVAARQYLGFLNQIRNEADLLEKAIHESMRNQMLIRMLNLEKCLIYFTTSLRANEPIWDRLVRIPGRELTEAEKDLIDDIRIEFRQARDLADIHSNILSGMMDAFASVISNNLNVVMKLLTSITIILMLPTLVASVYGMNVQLPFQHSPHAFAITMGVSIFLAVSAVIVSMKMKWF